MQVPQRSACGAIGGRTRAWCRPRPGTARSRARARPGWCACPASPARRAAPAAFPSPARYRRTPSRSGPKRDDDELRQVLQHALDHVVVVAVAGIDRDAAAVGPRQRRRAGRPPARRTGRARSRCAPRARAPADGALLGAARPASPCRRAGRRRGSRASRARAPRAERRRGRSRPRRSRAPAPCADRPACAARWLCRVSPRPRYGATPWAGSRRPPAARRSARTRRSACRRADTSRRRCAATPGRSSADQPLGDLHRAGLVERAVVAEAGEEQLQRLALHDPVARDVVDHDMREVRLAGQRAERGELRAGEAHQ